jgi:hypothetical protein
VAFRSNGRGWRRRAASEPIRYFASDDGPFYEPDYEPDFDPDGPEPANEPERDTYVDRAKEELLTFFSLRPESVFYQRQLAVIFEGEYFHWITARALSELVQEGQISSETEALTGGETPSGSITLYRANGYRYWKRDAEEIVRLVSQFSDHAFTSGLGSQGEMMFDAALPTVGFMPKGRKVTSYNGVEWTETKHDLDRVFERDGIGYGTEIKNTLGYIEKGELETKIRICQKLSLRPLFILRMAPKSYVNLIREAGGFALIFKYQLYPFGYKAFADAVRARLQLPTDCPARIEDGTVLRLLKWHQKSLGQAPKV